MREELEGNYFSTGEPFKRIISENLVYAATLWPLMVLQLDTAASSLCGWVSVLSPWQGAVCWLL